MIRRLRNAPEGNRLLVLDGHLEVVTRRKMKLLAHGQRENDLAFLRKHGGHGGKILPRPVTAGKASAKRLRLQKRAGSPAVPAPYFSRMFSRMNVLACSEIFAVVRTTTRSVPLPLSLAPTSTV
jgi:hypothetical protein